MPKLKTHKGAKRRLYVTGTGKVMHRKGHISHLRDRKAARARRQVGKKQTAAAALQSKARRLLPYGLA